LWTIFSKQASEEVACSVLSDTSVKSAHEFHLANEYYIFAEGYIREQMLFSRENYILGIPSGK